MAEADRPVGAVTIREFEAALTEVRRAVDLAMEVAASRVDVREYMEALFADQRRAADMAERERTKAADVLTSALDRSIREGDERLREHIANQVRQIEAALTSAQNLSDEQVASLRRELQAQHEFMQQQVERRFDATEKAAQKAEDANSKQFAAVNGFREQLADQAATLMPRREVEALLAELRRTVGELAEKLGKIA